MKPLYTLVSTGIYKGKKILLPSLSTTRSTKNIVKQSVFNSIRYDLPNRCFIEVFGGSAAMAIEALSNYAKSAYAIEIDKKAFEILSKNAKDFNNLKIFNADSFEILPKIINDNTIQNDEIILYLDPPFDIRDGFENIYKKLVNLICSLNSDKIFKILIEFNSDIKLEDEIGNFYSHKTKKFGSTSIKIYDKN